MENKKKYYPTRKDEEAVNPDGTPYANWPRADFPMKGGPGLIPVSMCIAIEIQEKATEQLADWPPSDNTDSANARLSG